MRTKLVRATPDFVYHFTVREHSGYTNLTIESQWLKAKDPLGRQTKLNINLDADALKVLQTVLSN
jgi:hypothetical protein